MTETLTCEDCGNDWSRERKRGRKPKVCPSCSEQPQRSTVASKPRKTKVEVGPSPAEAAAARREYLRPDRQIVTVLPCDKQEEGYEYTSWWCDSKIPMHKTCQSINNDACICPCHEEKNDG